MNEILCLNGEFHFTVFKANQCNYMLVDLLAHGILHETTAVTVIVSHHFQRLGNELAECRGNETDYFSSH
jgi:hypothetical protein